MPSNAQSNTPPSLPMQCRKISDSPAPHTRRRRNSTVAWSSCVDCHARRPPRRRPASAGWLQFVVDFGNRHHKSMACQHRGYTPDGPRHLEDLRIQHQDKIPPLSCWPKEVRTHGPRGSGDISRVGIVDDHPMFQCSNREPTPHRSQRKQGNGDREKSQI